MNKSLCFCSLFFLMVCTGFAQDTTIVASGKHNRFLWVRTISPDSLRNPGRNEIGVNIIPYAVYAMGSYGDDIRFTLQYKRVAQDYRKAWRFGIGMYGTPYSYWGISESDDYVYNLTDSTRTLNSFLQFTNPAGRINIGYEWRGKGRKRWQTWLGTDLVAGMFMNRYQLVDMEQQLNPSGYWSNDFSNGLRSSVVYANKASLFWLSGIGVNAGLRYAFNRYILVTAQTGTEFYFYSGKTYSRTSRTTVAEHKVNAFAFDLPGLLNEVAFVLRF